MRTSQQLYNQIRWDPRLIPSHYTVGARARRSERVQEINLSEFQPGGDIPWHRVLYIKGPRGLVWDRSSGLDCLVADNGAQRELDTISVLTYNCCAGRHGLPQEPRLARLLEIIGSGEFDILALQEVGVELMLELEAHLEEQNFSAPYLWLAGPRELLMLVRLPVRASRSVELSSGKWALLAELEAFTLAVVHFTSDYRGDSSELRAVQWAALQRELQSRPWLALGDFNASDREVQTWLGSSGSSSAISETGPAGATFDPASNPWAAQNSRSGTAHRYDRIFLSSALSVPYAVMETRIVREDPASDHFPLTLRLQRQHSPALTHLSSLAILPPARVMALVQPIRIAHDPAYPRWMPHLNLIYPAPAQLDLAHLQDCLAEHASFTLRFHGPQVFEHAHNSIIYMQPDAPSVQLIQELRDRTLTALGKTAAKASEFTPHMTIARSRAGRSELDALLRTWSEQIGQPVFEVGSLAWLTRQSDTQFVIAESLRLRRRGVWKVAFEQIANLCQAASSRAGQLEVIGSSAWLEGRELDLVWVEPNGDPDLTLSKILALPKLAARQVGSLLKFRATKPVDQLVALSATSRQEGCQPWQAVLDARALASYVGRHSCDEEFRASLAALLEWAERRQIKGSAYGFPDGLAWAVAAALLGRGENPLAGILAGLATWDGSRPLGLFQSRSTYRGGVAILAPGMPERNITRHLTASTIEILRREFIGNPAPPGPRIRLQCAAQAKLIDALEGRALALIVDLEKKLGAGVRPYPGKILGSNWAWWLGLPADCDVQEALALVRLAEPQAVLENP